MTSRLALPVALLTLASCRPGPVFVFEDERPDAAARVVVPSGESASIGTYSVVLSGKGAGTVNATVARDGSVTLAALADLNDDGATDLAVATTSTGSGSYGTVRLWLRSGGAFVGVGPPELTPEQRLGYRGHDTFTIEGGALVRSFPIYREGDANASASGGTARFRYDAATNSWVPAITPASPGR